MSNGEDIGDLNWKCTGSFQEGSALQRLLLYTSDAEDLMEGISTMIIAQLVSIVGDKDNILSKK